MKIHSAFVLVVAVLVIGLVVPTGAVLPEDQMSDDPEIVLTVNDGPNGDYAEITGGNLSIDLATVGVNPNALTTVRDVFNLSNHGAESVEVWITHDATDVVTFESSGVGSIQTSGNAIQLDPGESVAVGLRIDTEGVEPSNDPILEEFRVHVGSVSDEPTSPPSTGTGGLQPTDPPTVVSPGEGVEVVFDGPVEGLVGVRDVPVQAVIDDDPDNDRGPTAAIDVVRADGTSSTADGTQTVVGVNETVTLTGESSRFASAGAIDSDASVARVVDISVPTDLRDSSATVRIWVDATKLDRASSPQVGRLTDDGWQLLPTTIAGHEDGQVILEAQTPGFSRFAVFASPDVSFGWQHDGQAISGMEYTPTVEEPRIHDVQLSVTDALGRTSTATHRVVVNDEPTATIDVPETRNAGEPITLRANVTNEVGNATVTWTFPDGSRATGTEVQHTFDRGGHVVEATVEDEYGASSTVERQVQVGPLTPREVVVEQLASIANMELVGALVALLVSILLLPMWRNRIRERVPRRLPSIGSVIRNPFEAYRTPPQIVTLSGPGVDAENHRFTIDNLDIEDPGGDLNEIEISVTDSQGTEVAQTRIDVRDRSRYASQDHVIIPKSRSLVRPDEGYTFEVRAVDKTGRSTTRRSSLSLPTIAPAG